MKRHLVLLPFLPPSLPISDGAEFLTDHGFERVQAIPPDEGKGHVARMVVPDGRREGLSWVSTTGVKPSSTAMLSLPKEGGKEGR